MATMLRATSLLAVVALAQQTFASPFTQTTLKGDDTDDTPLPLVIWHGLGDNYAADGLKSVAELADQVNPGTLVHIIRLGADPQSDQSATFLGNVSAQIEQVCADLAADPILSTAPAIDALGFSQGGQFLRGYVERCNKPPVRSLVTFGSQHNGIIDFRKCGDTDYVCKGSDALLRRSTWSGFVQSRLVPAQYFRDPADYDNYLEYSTFLADINNERVLKNVGYKKNIAKLENFVMYAFDEDTTVVPPETAWFEEVNGTEVIPLRGRDIYIEDWLGLKELDRKGGLRFKTAPGEHMQITAELLEATFKDFYGPFGRSFAREDAQLDEL